MNEHKWVSELDMLTALGGLYDKNIPLPVATYYDLNIVDHNMYSNIINREITTTNFSVSSSERAPSWNSVFSDVRDKFVRNNYDFSVLDPPYVDSSAIIRWFGKFVKTASSDFELNVYQYIRQTVFQKLLNDDNVRFHELGAGPCFNSVAYARYKPNNEVHTYDWATSSQDITTLIKEQRNLNMIGHHYNFFESQLYFDENDVVFTACALEQLGTNWQSFLSNMLDLSPRKIVHIEPIYEKYHDTEFDNMAKAYHEKRGYLRNYYTYLLGLQQRGIIDITCDLRTGIGSRYHECYTVLAWHVL